MEKLGRCRRARKIIHDRLAGKNGGWYWGLIAVIGCGVLAGIMLFAAPVIGVADDGTLSKVMQGVGLAYPEGITANSDYFQRFYVWQTELGTGYHSLQTGVIWVAKMLGRLVTDGWSFDIRFLGFLYLLLFLPALCILVKAATDRLATFGQKLVPTILAVLMFADVGYLTYFNSFYPEALILICLMYMAGAAMNLQKKSRYEFLWLLLFAVSGMLLCFVRRYCLLAGLVGSVFCLAQLYRQPDYGKRIGVVLMAAMMVAASFTSLFWMESDFHDTDRFHAMSRGVLMGSQNPEETLAEFGIDPSYSLLTDVSAYEPFPVTTGNGQSLSEGFLDHYTPWDITAYYARHPAQMVSMVDAAVKTNLEVRRESCGNYEVSAGRPAGGKSVFWSAYTIFKNRSAPKTIGYLAVLVIVSVALTAGGFSLKKEQNRKNTIYLECVATLAFLTVLQTCLVIVESGTPALLQYNGQLGIVLDILLYFTVTEIIGRLNIL